MTSVHLPLFAALAIGLTACAPSSEEGGDTPSVPLGFELAAAKQSSSDGKAAETKQSQVIDLTVAELQELRASEDIWLIDVRTAEEVAEGMIDGASHIALADFEPGPELSEQAAEREIVLYCRSGRRSGIAGHKLSEYLGKPVRHLSGGYIAWTETSTAR